MHGELDKVIKNETFWELWWDSQFEGLIKFKKQIINRPVEKP